MKSNIPRILCFDIETRYIKVGTFKLGKVVLGPGAIMPGEKFDIICIAWKWVGDATLHSRTWDARQNSKKMLREFSKVTAKADIILTQNGDRFDILHINAANLIKGLPMIPWPASSDTLKMMRRHFCFPSYKLDYVAKLLGGTGKDRMVFADWVDIIEHNDRTVLAKMEKYCRRDVLETEGVWRKILKHCKPTAAVAKVTTRCARPVCPECQSPFSKSKGLSRRGNQIRLCRRCDRQFTIPSPHDATR